MVKAIKPVITVIESDEWQLLVLGITLLIFLTVILYFTRYYYKKNYQTTNVFNPQTGDSKPTVTAGGLQACKKGQCTVNLDTGLKKCPDNSQTTLYYDSSTQVCSDLSSCPSEVPYAVNGDGSVNPYGTCENPLKPCSCTSEKACAKYIISKFSVDNGNIYSSYTSDKNFLLEQVPYSVNDSYQGSIKIDNQSEFCKINSTYSNQLVGGCSFLNQTNDFLMKCTDESLDDGISVSPYSLDPYYLSTGGVETKQFCEIQPYLDSNWNNMTLCVNQNPCKIGNYTYNFDQYRTIKTTTTVDGQATTKSVLNNFVKNTQLNSRNFCQSVASNLDTYLTDLQYYTLSCIKGTQCNQLPNFQDDQKFFSGLNSELDISAINASYKVEYSTTTKRITPSTQTLNYNPFLGKVQSGDLVYGVGLDYTISDKGAFYINGKVTVSVPTRNNSTKSMKGIIEVDDQGHVTNFYFNTGQSFIDVVTGSATIEPNTVFIGNFKAKLSITVASMYFVVRVNPLNQEITFYNYVKQGFFTFDVLDYRIGIPIFGDTITYYPQYALNGFAYNTISTNDLNMIRGNVSEAQVTANIGYSFKIGNVKNSSIPSNSNTGGGYNPLFDISNNETFYRAGLSRPRGYVYKEFIEEEAVKADLAETDNQVDFNSENYQIKQTGFDTLLYNDISFYNPVWNNQYGRTECIRCNPLLVASINMAQISSTGSATGFVYDAVTIQFSGQDFGHYRKNFKETNSEKIWCFESRSNLNQSSNVISTTNTIYLERPNINIKLGDYVLSSGSKFPFTISPIGNVDPSLDGKKFYIFMGQIYQTANGAINFTPFEDIGTNDNLNSSSAFDSKDFYGLGVDNNTYQDFVKNKFITTTYSKVSNTFKIVSIPQLETNKGAFFFGNVYTATNINKDLIPNNKSLENFVVDVTTKFINVSIIPSTQVVGIKDGVITTNYKSVNNFNNTFIPFYENLQFISLDRNLYLNNTMADINDTLPGSGGKIQIDEITDNRITSIKVIDNGTGYGNISPHVRLGSYDPYFN